MMPTGMLVLIGLGVVVITGESNPRECSSTARTRADALRARTVDAQYRSARTSKHLMEQWRVAEQVARRQEGRS